MSPVEGIIDSHCHLQDPKFEGEHEAVVQRAREAGVAALVVVGYDLESSRRAVEMAESFESSACPSLSTPETPTKRRSMSWLLTRKTCSRSGRRTGLSA